jgi:hypothetical protein
MKYDLDIEYIKDVFYSFLEKKDEVIFNDSPEHARLLLDLMIGKAKKGDDVFIFSGSLHENAFRDALTATNGNLHIIVEQEPSTAIKNILTNKGFSYKLLPEGHPRMNHFVVSGNSFRSEINHDDGTAVANFNNPALADFLKKRYQEIDRQIQA